jgi:uncharacterized glyoxalase superfamily protein PhnB
VADLRGRIERALGRSNAPVARSVLTPYLAVRDARAAIRFYEDVFGAVVEGEPIVMDDGRIGHSELHIAGAAFFMADEFPEIGVVSPESQEGSSVSFVVHVPDVDAAFERAVARGAVVERPVEDGQHGSRAGWLRDPFGHRWNIGTPQEEPSRPLRTDTVDLGLRAPVPGADPDAAPVQLGYYTLGTTDAATTRPFFEALFGWRFDGPAEAGGHIADSDPPGGVDPSGGPSTIFFLVADIDSFAARVRELGGTVSATDDTSPSGRNATCTDPAGVPFMLWQPAPGY